MGDAGFRRYYRLHAANTTHIVMDAPPDKVDLMPFIKINTQLAKHGLITPTVHATDYTSGFMLLDDFGDELFLNAVSQDITSTPIHVSNKSDALYKEALTTLIHMQQCQTQDPILPSFNKSFMLKELSLFRSWFLELYLELTLNSDEETILNETYNWLTNEIAAQPQVFIHRDYHSRNIMLLPSKSDNSVKLGIIDFQDAMQGPFTYDLVSILKDCYIQWPRNQVIDWLTYFHTQLTIPHNYSPDEFHRAFDLCGLQRHLKVLGIFCRLHFRDNKSSYLNDLPLTFRYMIECISSYKELQPFYDMILNRVEPAFMNKIK